MEEVIEAQRDIYDLSQLPQPGNGRAVAEDPFLWLNTLFFSPNAKVAVVGQVLDDSAQMPGVLDRSLGVGWRAVWDEVFGEGFLKSLGV